MVHAVINSTFGQNASKQNIIFKDLSTALYAGAAINIFGINC